MFNYRWNVFHICTVFCLEKWNKEGVQTPSKAYKERFQRLLERYPLPKKGNWVYIWDSGCKSYYFWNKDDNLVSWLPPKHPMAVLGKSAATIRSEKDRPDMEINTNDEQEMAMPMLPPSSKSPQPLQNDDRYQKPAGAKKTKSRDLEKILRTRKGRRQFYENSAVVDPMDPASYGECGKGRWSSGLTKEERGDVDSTVSGTKRKDPDNDDMADEDEPEKKQKRSFSDEME